MVKLVDLVNDILNTGVAADRQQQIPPLSGMKVKGLQQHNELLHKAGNQGRQHKSGPADVEEQRERYGQPPRQLKALQDQYQRMDEISQ
ncbi:hypothetical protein D3C75_1153470 [compost metagenome]